MALSPLDGRYAHLTAPLHELFCEEAMLLRRAEVELAWLRHLALPDVAVVPLGQDAQEALAALRLDDRDAMAIKELETQTRHDIKAIELHLGTRLQADEALRPLIPFLHLGCTSEDISNVAYALTWRKAQEHWLWPELDTMIATLRAMAHRDADLAMPGRTHGQLATPTTLGKEWANFCFRLERQKTRWHSLPNLAKFNGAVGNHNALHAALPDRDWPAVTAAFLASLGLEPNPYTTQIEPHDALVEHLACLRHTCAIAIGLCRDAWGYASLGYLGVAHRGQEIGSSTMPHKVNPIDFENAEGNFGLAAALSAHMEEKLPISRYQRDLSDSTVLRNLGVVLGHWMVACQHLNQGLLRLVPHGEVMLATLQQHWELLAEAAQTICRTAGETSAYERFRLASQGRFLNEADYRHIVASLALPQELTERLLNLRPESYLGCAAVLAALV